MPLATLAPIAATARMLRRVRLRIPLFALTPARCMLAMLVAACASAGAAHASATGASPSSSPSSRSSGVSRFCDRSHELSAVEQDRLLRFAAVVRSELAATDGGLALISRSGLDLSRFGIRYSHSALAWQDRDSGAWSARQLYYACDEGRPRIFDQGLAGFAMGTDDAALGCIALVRVPAEAKPALQLAVRDNARALHLLAGSYSANAYPYSLRYQNCNQWVMELLAATWGELPDGEDLRGRAQSWLRDAGYQPAPVDVGSRWLLWASLFVPLLHLDDHPQVDLDTLRMQVSLPSTVEAFVRQRLPASERVEICHDAHQVVVHRGWTPVADGCRPGDGDRVVPLD